MRTILVLSTLLVATPVFAAGYQFTGTPLSPAVKSKITASANRGLKSAHFGALQDAAIAVNGSGKKLSATLTGTQQLGTTTDYVQFNAAFQIGKTKTGSLSVRGVSTRSRAYVGQEVTSPVWNLVSDGPK